MPDRPNGVTAVAALVWAPGAVSVITGILLLFETGTITRVAQFGGTVPLIIAGA